MSNTATFQIPSTGDNGKFYKYDEVQDNFDLSDTPIQTHVPGSGQFLAPAGAGSTSSGAGLVGYEVEIGVPIYIPVAATFDLIGCYVDTAAASSVVRLGIRNISTTTGGPGSLVLDAGTVSSATTGEKSISISQALSVGWYWLTGARQVATGAAIRGCSFYTNPFGLIPLSILQATAPDKQIWTVAAAGAFAASPTFAVSNSGVQGPPMIVLRRA